VGIRIVNEDGLFVPVVICDVCKQRIEKAKDGNYLWDGNDSKQGSLLMFEHKRCHHAGRFLSGELSWLPVYLGNSLRIDWDKVNEDIVRVDLI